MRKPSGLDRRPTRRLLGFIGSRRRKAGVAGAIIAVSLAAVISIAGAHNIGGFEIDADHTAAEDAYYSGNDGGIDWTSGANNNQGVFIPSTDNTPHTATGPAGCYGSNVDRNPAVSGASAFICDGSSDTNFRSFPDRNIVSPSGKTPDDVWPVKPGQVRPKNDFSHAYVHAGIANSPCNDNVANDVVLHLGGNVGDNEGSHFWGFEFNEVKPGNFDKLTANGGESFSLNFAREVGDFLVSFTVPGNANEPVAVEVFKVTGFVQSGKDAGDAIFAPAGRLDSCPDDQPQGLTALSTNGSGDVKAPPWNIPVCDPTTANAANTCRLANGTSATENLIAPRDFAEASIDLAAFGIDPCVSNVVFTSRSSHPLEGADIQDVGGADFPLCGKKSGTKFHDLNADGDRDAGSDVAIAGWPMKLYRDVDKDKFLDTSELTPVATTTTNASGYYEFTNLGQGDYIVCEAAQHPGPGQPTSGWNESLPNAGTGGVANCAADTAAAPRGYGFLMAGIDHVGNDFGNYQNATKSGVKFNDLNANGTRDTGEPGLSGWTIYVDLNGDGDRDTDLNGDGVADDGEPFAETGTDGAYTITGITPSATPRVIREVQQTGWTCSRPSPCYYTETFSSGTAEINNDFGNYQNATKSGVKFNDLNANGTRDTGEPGLSGWTIYVDLNGDGDRDTDLNGDGVADDGEPFAETGTDGAYTITGITPSATPRVIREVQQTGWTCSRPSPCYYTETFSSGTAEINNDFGNYQNATKSGVKFNDLNANGTRDTGEPGLSGWTIYVDLNGDGDRDTDLNGDGVADDGEPFAETGTDGAYTITGITPSATPRVIREVQQTGWTCSRPSPCYYTETFSSGTAEINNDFGNYQNATKSGVKFNDLNANGTRDTGEPGLSGWTIYVDLNGDGDRDTDLNGDGVADDGEPFAETGTDGAYTITGITPSATPRVIREVQQTGWTCSRPSPCYYTETFSSGTAATGNDFGNYRDTTVSGRKFKDADADGVRDATDTGLVGWTIHLFGQDGQGNAVDRHDVTDANGDYSFADVKPGRYTLCETTSDHVGWVQSYPTTGTNCSLHVTETLGLLGHSVTTTSGGTFGGRDFGNTPLSQIDVTFRALADLPDGRDATRATSIDCVDGTTGAASVGSVDDANTLTTSSVKTSQSSVVCTVTFIDP